MIQGRQLLCRRVPDGLVIDNLSEGDFVVAGEVMYYLRAMLENGCLWPYRAEIVGCSFPEDLYVVRFTEAPES